MNKIELVGRLTKDPEVKNTTNQVAFCNFSVAVDRKYKDQNGERQADFINCVAWRQQAGFISHYFKKGSFIGIIGTLQSRSFEDQSGQRRTVHEVVVDEVEFVGDRPKNQNSAESTQIAPEFTEEEMDYADLPFEV